jgi:hypothetical protein
VSKHTPAPWEYVPTFRGHYVNAGNYCVAHCGDQGAVDGAANARLIAAAPDLLAELKNQATRCKCGGTGLRTIIDYDHFGSDADDQPCTDEECIGLRALIARAEGA